MQEAHCNCMVNEYYTFFMTNLLLELNEKVVISDDLVSSVTCSLTTFWRFCSTYKSLKEVNEKIEALKKVKDGEDIAAIKKAIEDMNQTVQKIGQAMYAAQQAAGNSQSAPNTETPNENPSAQEAEFEQDKNKTEETK